MYLTKEEEKILSGELGDVKALALKIIVKVGEVLKAEKLINIIHAHISGISYFNIRDYGLRFIEDLKVKGAKFTVYTTANPYATVTTNFLGQTLPNNIVNKQHRIVNALKDMGVNAFTCAPYYVRRPKPGDHLAWAESNAVLYANSVIGARTNREGGPLALMSAIVGKTYYWGMHDDEYIEPCMKVSAYTPDTSMEASAIGYILGEKCPNCIPLLENMVFRNKACIRLFLAAFGTTSSSPMVILDKLTPLNKNVREKINKLRNDLEKYQISAYDVKRLVKEYKFKEARGKGLYIIGCPHLTPQETSYILEALLSKISANSSIRMRELWLISMEPLSRLGNITKELSRFNIKVLHGVCPVVTRLDMLDVDYVVTDSFKALHYIRKISGIEVFIDSRENVLRRFIYG